MEYVDSKYLYIIRGRPTIVKEYLNRVLKEGDDILHLQL